MSINCTGLCYVRTSEWSICRRGCMVGPSAVAARESSDCSILNIRANGLRHQSSLLLRHEILPRIPASRKNSNISSSMRRWADHRGPGVSLSSYHDQNRVIDFSMLDKGGTFGLLNETCLTCALPR